MERLIIKPLAAFLSVLLAASATAQPTEVRSKPSAPSVTIAPLFEDVALSGLFPDGKVWADAEPVEVPARILDDYRRLRPKTDTALRSFVEARFILRPKEAASLPPSPGLSLREHIESLWPILTRVSTRARPYSSLLALPHPYIVPGGRFTEIYYWDSYFTMLGLGSEEMELRRHMVDNFAYLIRTYGHIPNGNRSYYLSRSQPPFFFKMVELTDPNRPGRAFARYLTELRAEHRWWMEDAARARLGRPAARVVRMPNGSILNRYWDDRAVPRDESYRADFEVAAQVGDKAALYRNLRAAAESGWDFSSRWLADGMRLDTIRTTDLVPPDLNSILFGLEQAIAEGCAEVKDASCAAIYAERATMRAETMRKYLWNEHIGLYDDYSWRSQRLAGNVSAASLYPLFFKVANQLEADRTAAVVARELVKPGGLVSTNKTTGQQWDAPNGWPPLQWIAVNGLTNYQHTQLAEMIARRWLATVGIVYAETGKVLEKYDVVTRRPGGGGEYPLQDGFGWTNGTTIGLLKLYPDGRNPVLPPRGSASQPGARRLLESWRRSLR